MTPPAPRRRMYGTTSPTRTDNRPEDFAFTGPTFSDDEIDEAYGITEPTSDYCTCFVAGEYVPESCNRADHRDGAA